MRSIIVGVDGSTTSSRAAQVAAELARDTGATLHVVCAYPRETASEVSDGNDHWHVTASGTATATADRVAAELSAIAPGATGSAAEGKPADALVEASKRLDADLIVVGNKRVQGPARVLGSIAASVAQQAECDVYVAHTN